MWYCTSRAPRRRKGTTQRSRRTKKGEIGRTANFEVDADAPVRCALGAEDVEIPEPNFAHALRTFATLFIARNTDFFAPLVIGGIEVVDEIEVIVVKLRSWMRGLYRGGFEFVQEGVEMPMLVLSFGYNCA
jgi:hypothetical protein